MKNTRFIIMYEDYDAWYVRRLEGRRYHFMQLLDLVEACGESEAKEMGGKYNVDLHEIDLDLVPKDQIKGVMDSIGWDEATMKNMSEAVVATEVGRYGYGAPLYSETGSNREQLLKNCRHESARLQADRAAYEEAMNKPVNAIGSTAREFGQGDLRSALFRGIQEDTPEARIIGKIQGFNEGTMDQIKEQKPFPITSMSIAVKKVPSDDPIAYMMGYQDALGGHGKADAGDDKLAPAYLEGYKKGVAVKAGDEKFPEFHQ